MNRNTIIEGFAFNLKEIAMKREEHDIVTKRSILKVMASMYDPLGIVSPIVAMVKISFQEICTEKLNWNEEVKN